MATLSHRVGAQLKAHAGGNAPSRPRRWNVGVSSVPRHLARLLHGDEPLWPARGRRRRERVLGGHAQGRGGVARPLNLGQLRGFGVAVGCVVDRPAGVRRFGRTRVSQPQP